MSDLNKSNKVSLKRVIGNVVDILQLTDVSTRISAMASWAVTAELKIGSRNTYVKHECEIEVKNYRACLPENFVHLIALKHGNDHLDVTLKDFKHFHKGKALPVSDDKEFTGAGNKNQVAHPGVPNVHQINFIPVFQPGDDIAITVVNDNCGDVNMNTYNYTVQPGDDIPAIIAEFVNQINTVQGPGGIYTAVPDSTWFQIIANTPLVNLQITTWTNSNTGSINNQLIQRRILPVTDPNQNDPNCDVNVKHTSNNLANRVAYNLNDGIHAEAPYTDAGGFGNSGEFTFAVSKYAIENGYIHFTSIENGKVGIAYMGIALDEEGWPLIDHNHEDAVTHYLMYMLAFADFKRGKVSQAYFAEVRDRWFWLCGQARGDDELLDEDELQALANLFNQLIPLPNQNFF